MLRLMSFFCVVLLSITATNAHAQKAQRPSDEELNKTLDQVLQRYMKLFNEHDAKALAQEYSDDTDAIYSDGVQINSREEMEKSYTEVFKKNPNISTKLTNVKRKILSPRIVVESGAWEESGHSEKGLPTNGRYTTVLMKQKEKWLIVHDRAWAVPNTASTK